MPQGMLMAGWPVTSAWQVLAYMAPVAARRSSMELSSAGMGGARNGMVGIARRSWSRSTSS